MTLFHFSCSELFLFQFFFSSLAFVVVYNNCVFVVRCVRILGIWVLSGPPKVVVGIEYDDEEDKNNIKDTKTMMTKTQNNTLNLINMNNLYGLYALDFECLIRSTDDKNC